VLLLVFPFAALLRQFTGFYQQRIPKVRMNPESRSSLQRIEHLPERSKFPSKTCLQENAKCASHFQSKPPRDLSPFAIIQQDPRSLHFNCKANGMCLQGKRTIKMLTVELIYEW